MRNIYSSSLLMPKVRELAVSHSHTNDDETDSEDARGKIQELARKSLNIVTLMYRTYQTLIISVGQHSLCLLAKNH